MNNEDTKTYLTLDDAIKLLPEGDEIHTFFNPHGGMLIGADWNRKDIIEAIKIGCPQLAGEQSKVMKHGLVITRPDGEFLFIKTKET